MTTKDENIKKNHENNRNNIFTDYIILKRMYTDMVEKIKEKNWTSMIKDNTISIYQLPENIRKNSMRYIHNKNIRKRRLYRDPKYRDPKEYVLKILCFTNTLDKEAEDLTLEYLKKENYMREVENIVKDYYVPKKVELYDYYRRKREYNVRNKWRTMGLLSEELTNTNKDSPEFFTHPETKYIYPHLGYYLLERDMEYPHETLMTTEEEERCYEFLLKEYIRVIK